MPKFEIIIPTRDSARWIGIFLDAYRKAGIEPLYCRHSNYEFDTGDIVGEGRENAAVHAPWRLCRSGDDQFGARHASTKWILRVDDDEFPSRALLRWIASVGVKSLNQMWYISIRTLFVCDGAIHYSRSLGHFAHPQAAAFLHPHPRLFHADRVVYRQKVHTPGFEAPAYASFAPQDAFLVHCNCLLRHRRSDGARYKSTRRSKRNRPLKSLTSICPNFRPWNITTRGATGSTSSQTCLKSCPFSGAQPLRTWTAKPANCSIAKSPIS